MKTVFVGAGRGCRAVLEMFEQGRLAVLGLEILAVVDIDAEAPGMVFAREQGWRTCGTIAEGLRIEGLELVIELTGSDDVLEQLYAHLPQGIRVMDHVMARVFWDLERATHALREELEEKTALQASIALDRAELQEVINALPDVVVVMDREMRVLRVNDRFEQLAERPRGAVVGQTYCAARSPGPARCADFGDSFAEVLRTGRPVVSTQLEPPEGGEDQRHFLVTANPITDEGGAIVRVVQTSREITELVRLKRETEEWARRFRQIVATVHAVITIKGLDGRYLLVNPAAERLFGVDQEAWVGRTAAEVLPSAAATTIVAHDTLALDGGGYHVTEEQLTVEGVEHVLVVERLPLTDYRGQVVGLCYVGRDETQARSLQRDLLQAERLAAVGKLAAGVAHELNNPLTGILSFAEDLHEEAGADDPRRQDYELILNETLRCRRIVRDLLDFSRQRAPERRVTGIGPVARRVVQMVSRQAAFHNVTFDVDVADEQLPRVAIDAAQIQQAVLNLVINARDAMEGCGRIAIRGAAAADGQAVALSVADEGCGISTAQLGHIFEPFYTTKGERGNGLGLPAVKSVIEQHGGRVEVHSEVGAGTEFRLILPAAAPVAGGADEEITDG